MSPRLARFIVHALFVPTFAFLMMIVLGVAR